ncbi:MAG: carbamoyl-phosphate synthase domain-containing protein, partial [Phycisphaerae bacterium]
MICKLALEDGTVFTGEAFGAEGTQLGEVVFCTAMTGYQEIFTDPSYCGQIVAMTFPMIGNYGVNPQDVESARPYLSGFVVRELPPRPSNYRATASFAELLRQHKVMGIAGIDTRALTRRLRMQGALRGALSTEVLDDLKLVQMAAGAPSMEGANLVDRVCGPVRDWSEPLWTPAAAAPPGPVDLAHAEDAPRRTRTQSVGAPAADTHVVAFDCGIKSNILRYLVDRGCRVTVVPAGTPAAKVRALKPDGLL